MTATPMSRRFAIMFSLAFTGALFAGVPSAVRASDGYPSQPETWVARGDADSDVNGSTAGTSCSYPDYVASGTASDVEIQFGVDHTLANGTLHICPGTYNINATINLGGKLITLSGASAATTILDGGGTNVILTSSDDITVSDLTFQDGYNVEQGGAIIADPGTATISNSIFNGNVAEKGGAVFATYATVTGSTFTGNSAYVDGGAIGGAMFVVDATISNSTFTGNSAYFDGGAIFAFGTTTVSNSTFTGNSAVEGGAIIAGTLTVNGSTFTGNIANEYGGAIDADGDLMIAMSTFTKNAARGDHGGAVMARENITVTSSRFVANVARRFGGAISGWGDWANVSNSLFANNSVGLLGEGGAINVTTGTITRSKFTKNTAGSRGGAVLFWLPSDLSSELTRNTFVQNRAGVGGGAITLGPCTAVSAAKVYKMLQVNTFQGNRGRRTNNVERWYNGCG